MNQNMFYVIHNHLSRYKPDTRDACFFFEMKKTFYNNIQTSNIQTYKPLTSKFLANNKYINNKYFPLVNSRDIFKPNTNYSKKRFSDI